MTHDPQQSGCLTATADTLAPSAAPNAAHVAKDTSSRFKTKAIVRTLTFVVAAITVLELLLQFRLTLTVQTLWNNLVSPPSVVLYGNGTTYFEDGLSLYSTQVAETLRFEHAIALTRGGRSGVAAIDRTGGTLCFTDPQFRSIRRQVNLPGASVPTQPVETARDIWVACTLPRSSRRRTRRSVLVRVCKRTMQRIDVVEVPRGVGRVKAIYAGAFCCPSCPSCDTRLYCVVTSGRRPGVVAMDKDGSFDVHDMYEGNVLACGAFTSLREFVAVENTADGTHVKRLRASAQGAGWRSKTADVSVSASPSTEALVVELSKHRLAIAIENEVVFLLAPSLEPAQRVPVPGVGVPRNLCFDGRNDVVFVTTRDEGGCGTVVAVSLAVGIPTRTFSIDDFDASGALVLPTRTIYKQLWQRFFQSVNATGIS